MNSTSNLIVVGVICLVVGAAGGYFGRGLMTPAPAARGQFGANGQFAGRQGTGAAGQARGQFGGGRTVGTIETINGSNMTLKLADGSSKVILLTSDTQYEKTVSAQAADFPTGSNVVINGQQGTDGSITAASIQTAPVRPSGMPQPSGAPQQPQVNPAGAQ